LGSGLTAREISRLKYLRRTKIIKRVAIAAGVALIFVAKPIKPGETRVDRYYEFRGPPTIDKPGSEIRRWHICTVTILTSGTSYTMPNDWNNADNNIQCLGGAGGAGFSTANGATNTGGGGGEWRKATNLTYTTGANITIQIGAGGSGSSGTGQTDGGDTLF